MPYITQKTRELIKTRGYLSEDNGAGDLNYLFTLVIIDYLDSKGLSYKTCNDIVGALDNVKDEFRRRVQHPYEDMKIKENGDVYPTRYLGV